MPVYADTSGCCVAIATQQPDVRYRHICTIAKETPAIPCVKSDQKFQHQFFPRNYFSEWSISSPVLNSSSVTFSSRNDFIFKPAYSLFSTRTCCGAVLDGKLSIDVTMLLNSISSGEDIRPDVYQSCKYVYFSAPSIRAASSRV